MKKKWWQPRADRVEEHTSVDPYKVTIDRTVFGIATKKAKVFYGGEYVGELEQRDGKWYIPDGNPKVGWKHPMYPADLVIRGWLRRQQIQGRQEDR